MISNTTSSTLTLTLTDNSPLREFLNSQSADRHLKYKHVVFRTFPDIHEFECLVMWGVYSWSIPSAHVRYIKRSGTIIGCIFVSTQTDIVRDYLNFWHQKRLRGIHSEIIGYSMRKSAPLYVDPTIISNATYVDISSTYFSITNMVGWNLSYKPGLWLIPGRAPIDFPLPNAKGARSYLTSIGLPGKVVYWTGSRMAWKSVKNNHINMGLWSVTMDILHSIARIAVKYGARYIHTDGYILPSDNAGKFMAEVESFGLTPRIVAEGTAYIVGFGNYVIGDKSTKRFDPTKKQYKYSNLQMTETDWLRGTISKIRKTDAPKRLYERSVLCENWFKPTDQTKDR